MNWPIIHFDPNDPYPRDLVTAECAEDINVGDELIAITEETKNVGHEYPSGQPEWWVLDWGRATLCRCTGKHPSQHDGLVLITAELVS